MSDHYIGHVMSGKLDKLVEMYEAGIISREAFIMISNDYKNVVTGWCDGNEGEYLEGYEGRCGRCLAEIPEDKIINFYEDLPYNARDEFFRETEELAKKNEIWQESFCPKCMEEIRICGDSMSLKEYLEEMIKKYPD